MTKKCVKVVVSGAAGQIGYALVFRIASGQMFGPDTDVELRLLEIEPALPALQGVVMELDDCAFPLLKKVVYTSDLKEAMQEANWVLLIGSMPRKDGMERKDLLKINGGIFKPQGKAINNYAADDVRVFVVGNPCNTNCLIAMSHAPRVPRKNFYAMMTLDEKRARKQLAIKAGVDLSAVTQMTVWGNHSATQYPDFYNAKINHKPVIDSIPDIPWLQNEFIPLVQKRGAAVIKARGASSAASAANAVIAAVSNIINDTPLGESYSMALCSTGEYGVDPGLIFSFPCRTENGVVKVIPGLTLNEFGQLKFKLSLDELRQEREDVKDLIG